MRKDINFKVAPSFKSKCLHVVMLNIHTQVSCATQKKYY